MVAIEYSFLFSVLSLLFSVVHVEARFMIFKFFSFVFDVVTIQLYILACINAYDECFRFLHFPVM